jgi:hypothetical protein
MAEHKVVAFIKGERKKGVPDETIKIMLAANDWTAHDIAQAYISLDSPAGKRRSAIKRTIIFLVLLAIVAYIISVFVPRP